MYKHKYKRRFYNFQQKDLDIFCKTYLYFFPFYIKIDITILKGGTIMAYKITDACLSCGTCAGECPVGAITEGDSQYNINADECLDCGTCASVCPAGAIEEA